MTPNPFICGDAVDSANFFNRRQAIRRVTGRLLSSGQSTAIIGEPRTGKTSLLHYLAALEKRAELYVRLCTIFRTVEGTNEQSGVR